MTPSSGIDFLRPAMLAWALAAGVLLAVGLLGLAARRRDRAKLVAARHMQRFLPGFSEGRALARVMIAAGGVVLLALALTGPVRGWTMRNVQRRGLDLVVCIDTSRSMLVRDVRPDRITRAIREVGGLIDRLKGDRIALIAFSGDARDVAPLTHDRTTLRALLERVSPEDNLVGGTDLGAALQRALAMFDGRTGSHEAIVLLTDGEDLSGHGLDVARTAAERGIRIYVVGMGTEQGGKVPLPAGDGTEIFLQDEGGEVISALAGASLEQIARATGGDFLAATRSAAPLEELYRMRISRLEGRELSGGKEWVPHDRFQWILVLAFACMLVESGLRERSPRRRHRTELAAGLLVLFPLTGDPAGAGEVRRLSLEEDHAGAAAAAVALLESEAFAAAPERGQAESYYTVGVARQRAGERREAIEAFLGARDLAGPGDLRLDAAFNVAANLLLEAEDARAAIPELSGRQPQGALPGPGVPAPGAIGPEPDPEAPDPLDVAEAAYRAARTTHLERLRLDAADRDTRANLELIQRRLRELEEIRRQREQQQQEQDQEDSQEGDENQQGEESDGQEDPQSEQQQDDQQDEQQAEDSQDPSEEREQQEPQPDEESEQQQEQQRQPEPTPAEQEQQLMSREEIQRLLDQLAEIEEQAEKVRQALMQRRRVPVDKDW